MIEARCWKAAALSCLGIWVAGHIVPDQHHDLISTAGFARYIGLTVLLIIELKQVVAVYRAALSQSGSNHAFTAAKDAGGPEWAARSLPGRLHCGYGAGNQCGG